MIAAAKFPGIKVSHRIGMEQDVHFIADSWTRTLFKIYPNQYAIDFFSKTIADIKAHLSRSQILIAHLEDEPEEIVSYIVSNHQQFGKVLIVHFAYTKDLARRQGVLRDLLEIANPDKRPIAFTQPAKNANIMEYFSKKAIYDPSLWLVT